MGKKTNKKLVIFGVIAAGAVVAAIGVVVFLLTLGVFGNAKETGKTADIIKNQNQEDMLWNVYDAYDAYIKENLAKDYADAGLNPDMYDWNVMTDKDFPGYVSKTATFQYSLLQLDEDDIPELLVTCKMKRSYDDRLLLYRYTDKGVQKVDTQKMFYGNTEYLYYEKYQGKIYCGQDFNDEAEEQSESRYEMAVYDGKECKEQGFVSGEGKQSAWEKIQYANSLGGTMLKLKNETAEGENNSQMKKTTEESADNQPLTAEEESFLAYQQYINQGKVIEDFCKDRNMTIESEKTEKDDYESDTEESAYFDDLRTYLDEEEWASYEYGLAKLDADDSLEMVVEVGPKYDVMYYTYKDGKVQRTTAQDDFCYWTIYYQEKQNKLYVCKEKEANVVERELTTYSDGQLKVEAAFGTDYFGKGGAQQYEVDGKRVSEKQYKKSLAEKTGGNQGWKKMRFEESLQNAYQEGNEESKIY